MLRKHNLDGSYFTSTSIAITTFKNYGDLPVLRELVKTTAQQHFIGF